MICREIVHFHFGFSLFSSFFFNLFIYCHFRCVFFFVSCSFLAFSHVLRVNVIHFCFFFSSIFGERKWECVLVCGYPFFSWNIQIQLNSQLTINLNILVWVSEYETFVYFIVFDKIRRIRKIGKEKVFQLIHHLLATLTNIPWHPSIPGIFERYMANWAYSSKRRIQKEWNVRTPIPNDFGKRIKFTSRFDLIWC